MSKIPDAWEDDWSNVVDTQAPQSEPEPKKTSSKITKAQKRAQQAEFNRQIWAEAEGPKQPNYFLESRNVVPLRQEFKPPPVLLSRKGPIIQSSRSLTSTPNSRTSTANNAESSEDEDEEEAKKRALAKRQAQAAKDREEKQRKYDERRLELFGPQSNTVPNGRSGNSSPGSSTPPQSRSSTPNQRARRGRGRGQHITQTQPRIQQREVYDHSYSPKPDSTYAQRQDTGARVARPDGVHPVRAPKGPDGSGRGGFGFANRGAPTGELHDIVTGDSTPAS